MIMANLLFTNVVMSISVLVSVYRHKQSGLHYSIHYSIHACIHNTLNKQVPNGDPLSHDHSWSHLAIRSQGHKAIKPSYSITDHHLKYIIIICISHPSPKDLDQCSCMHQPCMLSIIIGSIATILCIY